MLNELSIAFNQMILNLGSFINNILAIPSKWIPLITPNMVLIVVSVLVGYFYGRKAFLGFKTISMVFISVLFYMSIKFIGVG